MGEVREITDTLSSLANNPNVRDNDVLQTLVQTMSKVGKYMFRCHIIIMCSQQFASTAQNLCHLNAGMKRNYGV